MSVGRRSGGPDTRSEIVTAAREAFARTGYDATSIRKIATGAGVDPALVYHYFDGKEALFAASIALPINPREAIGAAFAGDRSDIGKNLASLFVHIWELDEPREAFVGILRSTLSGNSHAAEAVKTIFIGEITNQLQQVSPGPEVSLRAAGMASQVIGAALLRYVVAVEPMASASPEEMIDLIAPRLQSYVDNI